MNPFHLFRILLLLNLHLAVRVRTLAAPVGPRTAPVTLHTLAARAEYCDIDGQEICIDGGGGGGFSVCWRGLLEYVECPVERPVCLQGEGGRVKCVE